MCYGRGKVNTMKRTRIKRRTKNKTLVKGAESGQLWFFKNAR